MIGFYYMVKINNKKDSTKYYNISQFAKIFNITEQTVRNWEKENKVKGDRKKVGSREDRIFTDKHVKNVLEQKLAKLVNPNTSEKMTLSELESFLWSTADILRGRVNAANYSKYIFGLLFYKRISDVWNEEYEEVMKEYEDKDLANDSAYHKVQLPKKAKWSKLIEVSPNKLGETINKNFELITKENSPTLDRVFYNLDFAEKEVFSDEVLQELVNHFSKQNFGNNYYSTDVLGDAFEYLIKQFADTGGATAGQHYSPREVERLIIEILKPNAKDKIYDPTVGSGGFLLESNHYINSNSKKEVLTHLYGQELNLETFAIAKINMFLHGIENADIQSGDTLSNPKFNEKFDIVVSNFPYSVKKWDTTGFEAKHKSIYPTPSSGNADYAFIIHIIESIAEKGKAGIIVPHGVLFRSGTESKIRQQILENDLIESVIGMPGNLFYGTSIPVAILILNKNKPKEKQNKVLFIDASKLYKVERNKNIFKREHIDEVVRAFEKYKNKDKFTSVVSMKDIRENEFNLNINSYVDTYEEEEEIDIEANLKEIIELEKEIKKIEEDMNKHLGNLSVKK